ncbi:MAG TPA: hypothetical protein VES91_08505 [Burkholderiaceae bacterium]|nr:hypothetical protein [Burkholderiaceae bacterium]
MLAGIAALVAWAATRERPTGFLEIGVSSTGEVKLREHEPHNGHGSGSADFSVTPSLRVSFASPWLISLRRGTMLILIWPDSLPRSIFRQLWVHLRWGRAVPSDDGQESARTNSGKSTYR